MEGPHPGQQPRCRLSGSTAHEAAATTDRPHRCPIRPPIRARRRGDTPGPAAAAAEYTRSARRRSPQPAQTRGRRARPGRAQLPAAAPPPPTQPPRDGQFPIDPAPPTSTGAAPAVSSPEAYRTPAARPSPPSVHGRHPITLNKRRHAGLLIADVGAPIFGGGALVDAMGSAARWDRLILFAPQTGAANIDLWQRPLHAHLRARRTIVTDDRSAFSTGGEFAD